MFRRCLTGILLFTNLAVAFADTSPHLARVHAVDESGQPVASAMGNLMILQTDMCSHLQTGWATGTATGEIAWTMASLPDYLINNPAASQQLAGMTVEGIIRAPGYAWAATTVTMSVNAPKGILDIFKPAIQASAQQIILPRGREIHLTLKAPVGAKLPEDLLPIVTDPRHYNASINSLSQSENPTEMLSTVDLKDLDGKSQNRPVLNPAQYNKLRSGLSVVKLENRTPDGYSATYSFRIPDGDKAPEELYILIHHSGFLRGFFAGPFSQAEMAPGDLEIQLPSPHTLSINLTPPPDRSWKIISTSGTLMISRPVPMRPDWGGIFQMENYVIGNEDWSSARWMATDLAPGFYEIMIDPNNADSHGSFHSGFADLRDETSGTASITVTNERYPTDKESTQAKKEFRASQRSILSTPLESDTPELLVKVTDADDKPITSAQAIALRENGQRLNFQWRNAREDGIIPMQEKDLHLMYFQGEVRNGPYFIFVRAPGYAPATVEVDLPTSKVVNVRLTPGKRVQLSLVREDGTPAPVDTTLAIIPPLLKSAAEFGIVRDPLGDNISLIQPTALKPGLFEINMPEQFKEMNLLVNEPGFCLAYTSEPITPERLAKEGNQLHIAVPKTGTGKFRFSPPPDKDLSEIPYTQSGIELMRIVKDSAGEDRYFQFYTEQVTSVGVELSLDSLPPGEYRAEAYTGTPSSKYMKDRVDYFQETQNLQIKEGETTELQFIWKPIKTADEISYDGTTSGVVRLRKFNGTPASDISYSLVLETRDVEKTVRNGIAPKDGNISLEDIPVGDGVYYSIDIKGNRMRGFKSPKAGDSFDETITLAPEKGDVMPNIKLRDFNTSAPVQLSDFRGKYVLVEFWASWCGPCRQPVRDLNLILERRKDWTDKLVVLGVSLDETPDDAMQFMEENGLTSWKAVYPESSLQDPEKTAFRADEARAFELRGVPNWYIIGPDGKLVTFKDEHIEDIERVVYKVLLEGGK